MLLFWHHW